MFLQDKNSLDYTDYDHDDDHNLVFYNEQEGGAAAGSDKKPSVLASFLNAVTEDGANASGEDHYSLKDVLTSIQKNETKCRMPEIFFNVQINLVKGRVC